MSITQNLEELLAVVPDAMVIVDKEGTIEVVNQHTEKLFGYNKEELIGQKIEVLIPERYKHHHDQHRNHYFSNPHVRPMGSGLKLYGLRKDGTEFGIEISLSPFQNRQYVCATIRDVSERFKYLEKFENLLESAPDAMVIVNKQGDIVLVNRQTEKLFGYSREELIGNKVEILIPTRYLGNHSSHRDKYFHNPHVRPMGSGLKLFAKRKDLSEFSVEISLSPIEPEGLVSATVRDVTERVLLTEFLISQNKQLEDFAYITSHNLRGPVSNLTSLLQFIREEDTKEGKDLLLGKLEKTVFNLEDTLNQLMEV
jgi:PAS domain S-box-containing protein